MINLVTRVTKEQLEEKINEDNRNCLISVGIHPDTNHYVVDSINVIGVYVQVIISFFVGETKKETLTQKMTDENPPELMLYMKDTWKDYLESV